MVDIGEKILEVLKNESFIRKLEEHSSNLFNLKLEYFFRDNIVINLNKTISSHIAVAEYPRRKGGKVDLSICRKSNDKLILESMIEIKYQFPKDLSRIDAYKKVVEFDLRDKVGINGFNGPDYFLLIVADWSANIAQRKRFESAFDIPINKMDQWQRIPKKLSPDIWEQNVHDIFSDKSVFENYSELKLKVNGALHDVTYNIYLGNCKR